MPYAMNRQTRNLSARRAGFSLIEVLVAILVLAIGMLGIAAMQAIAMRNSQSSFQRSQGVLQTYSIIDSMRANRSAANASRYDLSDWACTPPDDVGTQASRDLHDWVESMQAVLGANACGRVTCSSTLCTIDVRWDDSRGDSGAQEYTVTTRTLL